MDEREVLDDRTRRFEAVTLSPTVGATPPVEPEKTFPVDRTGFPDRSVAHGTEDFGATSDYSVAESSRSDSSPAPEPPGVEAVGSIIAERYVLREVIGEGGMGSVYLAEQTRPVRRMVALKLIKPGADSRSVLLRFEAERQALALMDHPNIAHIHDGGVTPSGRPFFVMEWVQGIPITEYCDQRRLPVRARLELFTSVCRAVRHAHQKGIIHRDLKPANVLVTEIDGRPTPKVIDFGVAKATEFNPADAIAADVGAIVGTPAYMSPEQADPLVRDIDTRTDVYALGVILYELLTGLPPLDSSRFRQVAAREVLRLVRENDPPRPSTKLSTAEGLPGIAANRSVDPAKLARMIHGELDWVVMKALEKDRSRRYESAGELAADIERHLAHEPVTAAPPSRIYRLRKFVRRYRGALAAIALVMAVLVAGVAGTTWGLIQARRNAKAERLARADADARRREAEAATRRADELASVAATERELALDAFGSLVGKVQTQLDSVPGTQRIRRELLDMALEGLRKVSAGGEGDIADLRMVEGHRRLGDLGLRLGDPALARENYEKVERIARALAAAHPKERERRREIASALIKLGDLDKHLGRRADAARRYDEARIIRAEFAAKGERSALIDFAQVLVRLGDVTDPDVSFGMYKSALGVREIIAASSPNDPRIGRDLRVSISKMASWHINARRYEEARALAVKASEMAESLYRAHPTIPLFETERGTTMSDLGKALRLSGREEEAIRAFERAALLLERPAAGNPNDLPLQLSRAMALVRAHRYEEALKFAEVVRKGAAKDPPILYDCGCIYALASAGTTDKAESARLESEAIGCVKAALDGGFVDYALIRTDPDLDGLRKLPAFNAMIAGLK